MYYIELADSENIAKYRNISPDIASLLSQYTDADFDYCAAIAFFPGQAVGVALARDLSYKGRWEFSWLFVLPKFRRLGIARALAAQLEQAVSARQGSLLFMTFRPDTPYGESVRPLLESTGYELHDQTVQIYRTKARDLTENIGWIREYALNELYGQDEIRLGEYELFKWRLLNDADVKYLEEHKGTEYPLWAYPLNGQKYLLQDMSIGIRRLGKVIGWVLTGQDAPDVLRFSISFMQEQYRGSPLFLMAYATILQLQVKADIPYMTTSILSGNKQLLSFIENAFGNKIECDYHEIRMIKNL
ncbi:MAG: hypothetical protein APF81_03535 [Desulfosporosinus sp. BRH_c37]|nr:MAG: hypothetical protein APF81_03535 [Desulfosporosinus sp. BRH_c37]